MIAWLPVFLSGVLSLSPATSRADVSDASVPYGAALNEPLRRVRSLDPQIIGLMREGLKRSVTFADLVAAVNASDVIVYIQRVNQLAPTIAGQLVIVPAGRKHGFSNTGTTVLHIESTLAAPVFEAAYDDKRETPRRWLPD